MKRNRKSRGNGKIRVQGRPPKKGFLRLVMMATLVMVAPLETKKGRKVVRRAKARRLLLTGATQTKQNKMVQVRQEASAGITYR